MDGFPTGSQPGEPARIEGAALDRLRRNVKAMGAPPSDVVPADGTSGLNQRLGQILGKTFSYVGDDSPVVPMQFPLLAVPRTADAPVDPFIFEEAAGSSSDRERGFLDDYLLPISEGRARVESSAVRRP